MSHGRERGRRLAADGVDFNPDGASQKVAVDNKLKNNREEECVKTLF